MNEGARVGDVWASLDRRDIADGRRQNREVIAVDASSGGFVHFKAERPSDQTGLSAIRALGRASSVRKDRYGRPQRHKLIRRKDET